MGLAVVGEAVVGAFDESDPVLATGVIPDSVIDETGRSDSDSNGLSKLE